MSINRDNSLPTWSEIRDIFQTHDISIDYSNKSALYYIPSIYFTYDFSYEVLFEIKLLRHATKSTNAPTYTIKFDMLYIGYMQISIDCGEPLLNSSYIPMIPNKSDVNEISLHASFDSNNRIQITDLPVESTKMITYSLFITPMISNEI